MARKLNMTGKVNSNLEGIVELALSGKSDESQRVQAIVDTGYNGFLTLPIAIIRRLGLQRVAQSRGTLATGDQVWIDVYRGTVIWGKRKLPIDIDAAEGAPLLGMDLMRECQLYIDVRNGGRVEIKGP
ncbi:MAG TPA: clan AA aspartic protease [Phycisphaerae bacterium]|jgi:clan AA aspartic protease